MRVIVRYHGRVQGVGFRATVRAIAHRHPVTGFVRNEPDGSVYMEVQGESAAVESVQVEVRNAMARFIAREEVAKTPENRDESGFFIDR